MNQRKRGNKQKGFTLIELLIVIVIIGVLTGMIIISTNMATAKAEATKIVANLRNIQSASVLYYSDNDVWPSNDITLLNPYMANKLSADSKYSIIDNDGKNITAKFEDKSIGSSVFEKLKEMEKKGSPVSVDVDNKTAEISISN